MSRHDEVEIACELVHETDRALLINDGRQEVWVPRSQILDQKEKNGVLESITIPEWLAEEKDLV
jgi:hypothetical protein